MFLFKKYLGARGATGALNFLFSCPKKLSKIECAFRFLESRVFELDFSLESWVEILFFALIFGGGS